MATAEKAILATFGTGIILAAVFFFFYFAAKPDSTTYQWLSACGLIPGFFAQYYAAFVPVKEDDSDQKTA